MKQATNSTFNEGLLMDMTPTVTPQTCLTDCLNGTLITYNGNEFTLQNDLGNVRIDEGQLPKGFIPLGMKEYGGIIYTVLYNPQDKICEVGSIPSPNYFATHKTIGDDNNKIEVSINSNDDLGSKENGYIFNNLFIKLFHPEEFELNPGDKYVIGYTINNESINIFGGIDNNDKTENPLYSVKLYAVDEDNKKYELKNPNIINDEPLISHLKYFNHTMSSILALEVSLNNINWFEAYVNSDLSDMSKLNFTMSCLNKLNSEGTQDDLYTKGVKISINGNDEYHEFGEDSANSDKFISKLTTDTNFEEGLEVNVSLTPYTQHQYLNDLTKNLRIKIGEIYDSSTSGDLFQYKYNSENKVLRLDFDANVIGYNNPYLYLEFYDLWGDYSVIVPIEDINPAGRNTVFIDCINEAFEYNDSSSGVGTDSRYGTPYKFLMEKDKSSMKDIYKADLSETYIRRSEVLRENNLYIVRICSLNYDENAPEEESKITDSFNKFHLLLVNGQLNDKFDEAQEIDNLILSNFNEYSLNVNNVLLDINSKLNNSLDLDVTVEGTLKLESVVNENDPTFKKYYKIGNYSEMQGINNGDVDNMYFVYGKELIYDLSNSYSGKSLIGNLSISINVDSGTIDCDIIQDPNLISNYEVKSLENNKLTLQYTTKRGLQANIYKSDGLKISYHDPKDDVYMWETMCYDPTNPNTALGIISEQSANRAYSRISWEDKSILYGGKQRILSYKKYDKRYVDNDSLSSLMINSQCPSGGVFGVDGNRTSDGDHEIWYELQLSGTNKDYKGDALKYFLILRDRANNFRAIEYNSKDMIHLMMTSLYRVKVTGSDELTYTSYYSKLQYDYPSETIFKPSLKGSIKVTVSTIQLIKGEEISTNTDLISGINKVIEKSGINGTINYLGNNKLEYVNINSGEITEEQIIQIPNVSIMAKCNELIINGIANGKTDLEINESDKLVTSPYKNNQILSKDPAVDKFIDRFTILQQSGDHSDIPIFAYNGFGNVVKADWALDGPDNDSNAFQYDRTAVDRN